MRAASSSASWNVGSPGPLTARSTRTPAPCTRVEGGDDVGVLGDGRLDDDERRGGAEALQDARQLGDGALAERDLDGQLRAEGGEGVGRHAGQLLDVDRRPGEGRRQRYRTGSSASQARNASCASGRLSTMTPLSATQPP